MRASSLDEARDQVEARRLKRQRREAILKARGIRPRRLVKAAKDRDAMKQTKDVRAYVFGRERNICRCCRFRKAESMHEIIFRSQGGKVSRKNSIGVCGDGVRGCHGLLQRHEIEVGQASRIGPHFNADDTLAFRALTLAAAECLRIRLGEWIVSPVMQETEIAS